MVKKEIRPIGPRMLRTLKILSISEQLITIIFGALLIFAVLTGDYPANLNTLFTFFPVILGVVACEWSIYLAKHQKLLADAGIPLPRRGLRGWRLALWILFALTAMAVIVIVEAQWFGITTRHTTVEKEHLLLAHPRYRYGSVVDVLTAPRGNGSSAGNVHRLMQKVYRATEDYRYKITGYGYGRSEGGVALSAVAGAARNGGKAKASSGWRIRWPSTGETTLYTRWMPDWHYWKLEPWH